MKIVLDLDGVIINFDRGWTDRWNDEFDDHIPAGAPQRYNELHLLVGLDTPAEFWAWFQRSGGFWDLPLYPGADRAVTELSRWGEIALVTSRPAWARLSTINAIGEFDVELAFLAEKWRVDAGVYVDDNPETLGFCYIRRPRSEVWRVERPWNQIDDYPGLYPLPSARGLPDLVDQFRQRGEPAGSPKEVLSAPVGEDPPLPEVRKPRIGTKPITAYRKDE